MCIFYTEHPKSLGDLLENEMHQETQFFVRPCEPRIIAWWIVRYLLGKKSDVCAPGSKSKEDSINLHIAAESRNLFYSGSTRFVQAPKNCRKYNLDDPHIIKAILRGQLSISPQVAQEAVELLKAEQQSKSRDAIQRKFESDLSRYKFLTMTFVDRRKLARVA